MLRLSRYQRNKFSQLYRLEDIHRLGNRGIEFEHFIGYLFEKQGYEVKTTPRTADHGVDLLLSKAGQKFVVQCKHYRPDRKVEFAPVQQLYGAMHGEAAYAAFFVTNSSFTQQGTDWVRGKPIRLVDGLQLEKWAYQVNQIELNSFYRKSLWDWLRLQLGGVGGFFSRQGRAITLAILTIPFILLMAAILALWVVFSPTPTKTVANQSLPTRSILPAGNNNFDFNSPTPTIGSILHTVEPVAVPTPIPTPAARLKDATSSPCYVGQIKGNSKSKFYHEPGWPYYNSFKPNDPTIVCFDNVTAAQAAGYKPGQQPATPKTPAGLGSLSS